MRRLIPIALFLIAAIIYLANKGAIPSFISDLYNFPNGDKVGHLVVMGIFNLLVALLVLPGNKYQPLIKVMVSTLVVSLIITAEEFTQKLFPTRTFSLLDLAYSYAGVLISLVIIVPLALLQRKPIEETNVAS